MRANRSRDTQPEIRLRRVLHRRGHRFRVGHSVLATGISVRPDIVFTRQRVAVFVDGCFWHSCAEHGTTPAVNRRYWLPKLSRVAERDRRVCKALSAAGWRVIRVWEHVPAENAANEVEAALRDA